MKIKIWAVMLPPALLALSMRAAQADVLDGLYVGADFGRARANYDTGYIDSQLAIQAAAENDALTIERRSTSRLSDVWSAEVGYFFTPIIGIEAGFLHLGQVRYIAVGSVAAATGVESVVSTTEVTSHGPTLSMRLRLPLAEGLAADLRLGDYIGKTTFDNGIEVGTNTGFLATSKSGSSLLAGLGVAYEVAAHYSVRFDYWRVEQTGNSDAGGKFSVNLLTVGLSYTF